MGVERETVIREKRSRGHRIEQVREAIPMWQSELVILAKEHALKHPGEPVNLASFARQLEKPVSRERVRQVYPRISAENDLPPAQSHTGRRYKTIIKDQQVLELRQQGFSTSEIVQSSSLSHSEVELSIARLIKEGKTKSRNLINRASVKRDEDEIMKLRNKGKGNKEIARRLHLRDNRVNKIIQRLLRQGKIERMRAKKRSKEEIAIFDA